MDGEEILRIIDALHRDKSIDKELLFQSVEVALATAARKKYDAGEELTVRVDRRTGDVAAFIASEPADFVDLGRIGAQTAKQVMIQRIREAEQDVVLGEFTERVGEMVTGVVQRLEGGNIIVGLGRGEGILPRSETVRGESYSPGDRIKALITEVKRVGLRVRIILSRTHPDLVRRLFEVEVPEIGDGVIEIKRVAREPGYRTKIAVSSYDMRVDCIGACVGIRGTRIKAITEELNGEKIDIIRWNDSVEVLIMNALRPAEISSLELEEDSNTAAVHVADDQLSLAIGRKGQNVRLASKLTGWEINLQPLTREGEGGADGAQGELALTGGAAGKTENSSTTTAADVSVPATPAGEADTGMRTSDEAQEGPPPEASPESDTEASP
jgi:N utilization substance protein A